MCSPRAASSPRASSPPAGVVATLGRGGRRMPAHPSRSYACGCARMQLEGVAVWQPHALALPLPLCGGRWTSLSICRFLLQVVCVLSKSKNTLSKVLKLSKQYSPLSLSLSLSLFPHVYCIFRSHQANGPEQSVYRDRSRQPTITEFIYTHYTLTSNLNKMFKNRPIQLYLGHYLRHINCNSDGRYRYVGGLGRTDAQCTRWGI